MSNRRGDGDGIKFLRGLIGHTGDECIFWPFAKIQSGRGHLGHNGKLYRAHRLMCELAHGPAPIGKPHAAHSCGNGHLACVNPKHLSWKTPSENEADKLLHGTAGGGRGSRTTLTPEQIADIRANKGVVPILELAERHGLKYSGVRYWQSTTHNPAPPGMSPTSVWRRENNISRAKS